jgi:2'-5' RNA ligase
VADLFRGKGVKELERLATALYSSVTQGWETSVDSRARFVHEVKPHVTLGEAKEAVQAIDALRQDVQSRTASH